MSAQLSRLQLTLSPPAAAAKSCGTTRRRKAPCVPIDSKKHHQGICLTKAQCPCYRAISYPARPLKHSVLQRLMQASFQAGTWWRLAQTEREQALSQASREEVPQTVTHE